MNNAFYMILYRFGEELGMKAEFTQALFPISLSLIVMSLLLCFFGIKLFKVFSSIMMFILIGLFFLLVMKKSTMGEIVTTFIVLGLLVAALTYRWYRLSAFIIALFIGFSMTAPFIELFWVNFVIGVVLGIIVNLFPVTAIMIITSLWGGLYFTTVGIQMLEINVSGFLTATTIIFMVMMGIIVQYAFCADLLELPLHERRLEVFK